MSGGNKKKQPARASPASAHFRLAEVAAVLRPQMASIIRLWEATIRESAPAAAELTSAGLRSNLPEILRRLTDALAADSAEERRKLLDQLASQGVIRFQQHFDVQDVMTAHRVLRGVILEHAEAGLPRPMSVGENVGLNMILDEMFQQGVAAFVGQQREQLEAAAEAELKYLSFLSHDLNNNLQCVTLMLKLLRQELLSRPDTSEAAEQVDSAEQSIRNTVDGMRRLLDHERLRKGSVEPTMEVVGLHSLVSRIASRYDRDAGAKGVAIAVEVEPSAVVRTDPDLAALVVQNLVGNAVKYSSKGTVRITGERRREADTERWVLSVSDAGPGITAENKRLIFEAFRRGKVHGHEGIGLGLAIAAQAAKLLGAELTVKSRVDEGSTFSLALLDG